MQNLKNDDSFYVLKSEDGMYFSGKWAYGDVIDPVNYGDSEKCPKCGGAISDLEWLPPYRIKLSTAKPEKWGDIVWGAGIPELVSSRFKEIYEAEGLTGITKFSAPVEIVQLGKKNSENFPNKLPVYHIFYVPWGGANQDDIASNVIHKRPEKVRCNYCRVGVSHCTQDRIVIEKKSWDGSDIFRTRGAPVIYMVSEKFRQVSVKHQFKNIWLIPADEYHYDQMKPWLHFKKYFYQTKA